MAGKSYKNLGLGKGLRLLVFSFLVFFMFLLPIEYFIVSCFGPGCNLEAGASAAALATSISLVSFFVGVYLAGKMTKDKGARLGAFIVIVWILASALWVLVMLWISVVNSFTVVFAFSLGFVSMIAPYLVNFFLSKTSYGLWSG